MEAEESLWRKNGFFSSTKTEFEYFPEIEAPWSQQTTKEK